jgi:hypothetical protein
MNDFTKEELQMLIHGIHLSIDEYTQHRYAPLANKIQSMIDNYCEVNPPFIDSCVCSKCNEEWRQCECKK